jgi:ABC-2 type transport system permease protein
MRRALAMAVKEVKQVMRDPWTLGMLILLPMGMLVLYGYALSFDVENVALAVQDRDLSSASRALIDTFVAGRRFALVADLPAGSDIGDFLDRNGASAVLIIPERYGERLAEGRDAEVQVLVDGVDSSNASTVMGYLSGVAASYNGTRVRQYLGSAGAQQLQDAAIRFRPRVWYNPELQSSQFLVPGLVAFLMMFTAVLSTALSVVREKERGTLEQLRVKPLRTVDILVGKLLPYLFTSLAAVVLILTAARLLFGVVVRGPYLDLFAATVVFLIGALGWGLLVSTLADSQAVAFQIGVMTALLPTLLLSGFIFPISNMPPALQLLTRIVPARYYLVILRGIVLKGAGLSPFWEQVGALGIYAFIVLTLASVRFARQEA